VNARSFDRSPTCRCSRGGFDHGKGSLAEALVGLDLAVARGRLALHESGTFVRFIQTSAELSAQGTVAQVLFFPWCHHHQGSPSPAASGAQPRSDAFDCPQMARDMLIELVCGRAGSTAAPSVRQPA